MMIPMSQSNAPTIEDAFRAIQGLPEPAQQALVAEIMERVESYTTSHLSAAHLEELDRRLAAEPTYASEAEVAALFARHGVVR